MAISPATGERVAVYIARIYADAEQDVMQILAREFRKDEPGKDIEQWAESKLRDLQNVRSEIRQNVVGNLEREIPPELENRLEEIYKRGQGSAVADLRRVLDEDDIDVTEGFTRANRRTVEALAKETVEKTSAANMRILRSVNDQYRRIVSEATEKVATGVATRQQASQQALNKFANRGVTGFVDQAGRNWDIQSYAEMSVRSASGRAAIQGQKDRLQENDRDLVIVSDHAEECELCRPWEGKVLSISGEHNTFPPLSQAEEEGLFHPNCAHSLGAYIHNLTEPPEPESTPDEYEDRQQQRYLERGIRKWKRRKAAGMTEDEQEKAQSKVREWQGRLADFIEDSSRRRKYERESLDRAR